MSSSEPTDRPTPPFPEGPLNEAEHDGDVAVRVSLTARFSGTVDLVVSASTIERRGSVDEAVQYLKEDLVQMLIEQGATDDDPDIDDVDEWVPAIQRWQSVQP